MCEAKGKKEQKSEGKKWRKKKTQRKKRKSQEKKECAIKPKLESGDYFVQGRKRREKSEGKKYDTIGGK